MKVEVYIQGQRLDLYDDEQITVKQVTKDLKDISKIFADFSQTFNVPASKNNNKIFYNWYNPDVDNGFDARTRVEGSITINTLDFKHGKIRLDSVDLENNKPKNYKITFFGKVINIKDLISEDQLGDLDWLDNFNHAYSGAVVKDGLINGLDFNVDGVNYTEAVIYPMISYQRQWFYNSDITETTNTDQLTNIAANGSAVNHGVNSKYLKPAIKLSLLVKAIEQKYNLDFNSPFFDLGTFKNIYVNLNRTTDSLSTGIKAVESVSGTFDSTNGTQYACEYIMQVIPDSGFENVPYKIRLSVNGQIYHETTQFITGTQQRGTGDEVPYDGSYELLAEVITEEDFEFSANTTFRVYYVVPPIGFDTVFSNTFSSQVITLEANIRQLLPEVEVYEFLTNLFKIFNLVATSDNNNIYIQSLQDWYTEGEIYDVTQFVDFKTEKVKRGKIYKEISYKFEESEQILYDEFSQSNKENYGDLLFKLTDANGNVLQDVDGDTLEIQALFENPIHERLFDLDDNSETTIQYNPYFNREIKPIAGNMFMFYGIQKSVASNPIRFINDGTAETLSGNVIMPSHSYLIDQSTFNLNFNAEVNEYTSTVFPATIYKTFWDDYITDMFSVKRRIFEFKAIFPDYFLNQLKLNDRLIIKDRRYIINSISSDLVDRMDTLELLNDIYDAPLKSDTLNTSLFRPSFGLFASVSATYDVQYIGTDNNTIRAIDTGDGVTWINVITKTTSGNVTVVEFTLQQNNTGAFRSLNIQVTDGINNPVFSLTQKSDTVTSSITFDDTSVTFDSNIITFDNG